MRLDDAQLVGVVGAGGAAVDGTALEAIAEVGLVYGAGGMELCGIEGEVFLDGDAEGHGGGGDATLAGYGFFGGRGGAAAAGGTTDGGGVVLGKRLGVVVVLDDVWGSEAKSVVSLLLLLHGVLEGALLGRDVGGAERGDWGESACCGGDGAGIGGGDGEGAHIEGETGGGARDAACGGGGRGDRVLGIVGSVRKGGVRERGGGRREGGVVREGGLEEVGQPRGLGVGILGGVVVVHGEGRDM